MIHKQADKQTDNNKSITNTRTGRYQRAKTSRQTNRNTHISEKEKEKQFESEQKLQKKKKKNIQTYRKTNEELTAHMKSHTNTN